MAVCRGCGREIVFIRTPQGRMMPCEKELRLYWAKDGGKERIVSVYGEVFACELTGEPETASGVGHLPHWPHCEGADKFRGSRPRAKKEPVATPEQVQRHMQNIRAMLG